MVIPTFNSFAATPDAGSAFVGGAGIGQRAVESRLNHEAAMARVAAERSAAAMSNATRQQELQTEVAMKQQQLQLQQQQLAQEALQKQQQLEIEKAYRESMVGLQQQKIQTDIDQFNLDATAQARQFDAQERMRRELENSLAVGDKLPDALARAASMYGVDAGAPSSIFSDIIQNSESAGGAMPPPGLYPVEGEGGEDYSWFPTSHRGRQLVKKKTAIDRATEIEGSEYMRIGDRVVPKREPVELRDLKKRRDRVADFLDSADAQMGKMAWAKNQEGGELRRGEKALMADYLSRQRELRDLETKIDNFNKTSSGIRIRAIRQKGE